MSWIPFSGWEEKEVLVFFLSVSAGTPWKVDVLHNRYTINTNVEVKFQIHSYSIMMPSKMKMMLILIFSFLAIASTQSKFLFLFFVIWLLVKTVSPMMPEGLLPTLHITEKKHSYDPPSFLLKRLLGRTGMPRWGLTNGTFLSPLFREIVGHAACR